MVEENWMMTCLTMMNLCKGEIMERNVLVCLCGKNVKVHKYAGVAPYTCSVCRGVITPKKAKKQRVVKESPYAHR